MSDTSIAQLELEYRQSNRRDRYGNVMRYLSTYTRTDGVKNYTDAIMGSATAAGYLGALAVHGYKDGVYQRRTH